MIWIATLLLLVAMTGFVTSRRERRDDVRPIDNPLSGVTWASIMSLPLWVLMIAAAQAAIS